MVLKSVGGFYCDAFIDLLFFPRYCLFSQECLPSLLFATCMSIPMFDLDLKYIVHINFLIALFFILGPHRPGCGRVCHGYR